MLIAVRCVVAQTVGYEWLPYETCSYLEDILGAEALYRALGVLFFFVPQWFSGSGVYQNHLEGLLNRVPHPTPGTSDSDSAGLGQGLRGEFVTSPQVKLMLWVQGPHF